MECIDRDQACFVALDLSLRFKEEESDHEVAVSGVDSVEWKLLLAEIKKLPAGAHVDSHASKFWVFEKEGHKVADTYLKARVLDVGFQKFAIVAWAPPEKIYGPVYVFRCHCAR